jgi:hypothetical protein
MRTGISITLKPSDRRRLKALARDRNAPQKHVNRSHAPALHINKKYGVEAKEQIKRALGQIATLPAAPRS